MELTFQKIPVSYLKTLVHQAGVREETLELPLPEHEPDAGRVVGAWAVPVVRSRELRSGSMGVSGGVNAWVTYIPADETEPRTIGAYLPFSMSWDAPQAQQDGIMQVACRMAGADARIAGARKLLLRVNIACEATAMMPGEAELFNLPDPPKELEVLRQHHILTLPAEAAEKQLSVQEVMELPGGSPPMESLISYTMTPDFTEAKVLGDKAVFKGVCKLHLLYMTPEKRVAAADLEMPLTQYAELSRHYDREEEVRLLPLITEAEMTLDPEAQELRITLGLCLQCTVMQAQTVETVADLYCPHTPITPVESELPLPVELDSRKMTEIAEVPMPARGTALADAQATPLMPRLTRAQDKLLWEVPLWCSILYYDEAGQLQGRQSRAGVSGELRLCPDCSCQGQSRVSGQITWSMEEGKSTLSIPVEMTAQCRGGQGITMITGASLGQRVQPDPNRPSVILRVPEPEDTLWSLAKKYRSTVDAICKANHIKEAPLPPGEMLLIPVL